MTSFLFPITKFTRVAGEEKRDVICTYSKARGHRDELVLLEKIPIEKEEDLMEVEEEPVFYDSIIDPEEAHKIAELNIEKDSRISYENLNFFLLIPYMKEELKTNPRHTVISLDSGIRTFQTGYCPEGHTIEICKDTNSKLKKYYSRLDELNTRYFATKKDNGSFAKDFKGKRTAISRRRKRYFEKIRNIIDDMHWKTIKFLTENYQDIIISDFRVKELLQLNELRHISKRVLSSLSHYRFRQRLIEKCQARGNYLGIFDESYMSKTCSRCGKINQNLGSSKIFSCPFCYYIADRDINAARNIYLKTLDFLNSCVLILRNSGVYPVLHHTNFQLN